eukprot:scaffold10378_cov135-Skeletonema_menzelii.AAC.1
MYYCFILEFERPAGRLVSASILLFTTPPPHSVVVPLTEEHVILGGRGWRVETKSQWFRSRTYEFNVARLLSSLLLYYYLIRVTFWEDANRRREPS